ncbi:MULTISPECIES: hypothetical protein [Bacillus]|uniref:hypothetical protein n=1 Tax=Bacillus TaxID=1386 RepID=UPI000D013638|nr:MULTISPECIES: hypothetical protein [Bacillus]UYO34149.1 hypothetical protein NF868_08430 [Bacillus zhangzhouensis]MCY7538259.1 hypothetical protein [Bacillus pumilus]MEC3593666.1 hypothetical protein [Bacillus pumilus]PRO42490.1 hypothetical protein C6W18_01220 [Bacillus sp. LLTC93]RAP20775.1 hypothetical protein C2W59_00727 [Bacillus pumilus]
MYPHTPYFRGGAPGIPPYESRVPLFFGFGAPLVGGLLGGFLGSAIFNYPRPYYPPPPPPPVPPPYGGGYPPYY